MTPESWLNIIHNAEKTAVISNGRRKVHFLLEDKREMVEEYDMNTNVVVRRAWKRRSNFGQDNGWLIEVGDPEPRSNNVELYGIQESISSPLITRRITKQSLEWRIRNLPYPKHVYSVTIEEDKTITVRTSNKKYFTKINIPDLERIGLILEQDRLSFIHQYNTLIITYKKPSVLLDVERKVLAEVLQLETSGKTQCPIN